MLGLWAAPAPTLSDTIYLRDGRTLHGQDCRRQGTELRCTQAGGVVGIPISQVERVVVEKKEPGPATRKARPPVATAPAAELPPLLESVPSGAEPTPESARSRIGELNAALGAPAGETPAARHELAVLYAFLGNRSMLARDYEAAATAYRSALEHDPSLTVARLNLCTALIDLNHHDAAEEMLVRLLAEQPGNARAMELMGEVAIQTGRIDEAIELWERSLAAKPNEGLRARLARARRLEQAEDGFQRSDAAHFSVKFDGEEATPGLASEILSYLEESFSQLSTRFAHDPIGVIHVTLYSQKAFHEATDSPDWVGGLFDGQLRVPIGGLSHLTPQVRRVLIHELTHCFVTSKSHGNAPQWIQEGIAQVLEGKSAQPNRASLRQANEVLGGAEGPTDFSYLRALSQMEFFLHTWSDSHLNDLLDHLARGTDIDDSMRAVTGLSYKEFLKAWGESLAG